MSVSDLTGYTWVGNDIITFINGYSSVSFNLNYKSNFSGQDYTFSTFKFQYEENDEEQELHYINNQNDITAYVWYDMAGGGHNSWYPGQSGLATIEITGGTDATNSTLIQWLQDNGTLTAPQPQPSASISIGTLSLAKAFIGNSEIASIWLENNKLYEKSGTPSGYSGDITTYLTGYAETKIKFDTPPTSDNDYDSYVNLDGTFTGSTTYTNKTKVYAWGFNSLVRINGITYNGGSDYSQATEVLLTGNYDIELGYAQSGGAAF